MFVCCLACRTVSVRIEHDHAVAHFMCGEHEEAAKLTAAGFTHPTVEVTRTYTDQDLAEMADDLADTLPDGIGVDEAIASLNGAFASAFIRADKS
mgnify:CR=1 FL=1